MMDDRVTESTLLDKIGREKLANLIRPELENLYEGDDYLLLSDAQELAQLSDKQTKRRLDILVKDGLMKEMKIMSPKGTGKLVSAWVLTPEGLAKVKEGTLFEAE